MFCVNAHMNVICITLFKSSSINKAQYNEYITPLCRSHVYVFSVCFVYVFFFFTQPTATWLKLILGINDTFLFSSWYVVIRTQWVVDIIAERRKAALLNSVEKNPTAVIILRWGGYKPWALLEMSASTNGFQTMRWNK